MIKDALIGCLGLILAGQNSEPARTVGSGLIVLSIARALRSGDEVERGVVVTPTPQPGAN